MKPAKKNQGFTLIEMLVTLLIGTVLLLALGAVVSGIGQSQQRVEDYESIQETLRFTTAMLSRSLRTAERLESAADTPPFIEIVLKREGNGSRIACNGDTPVNDPVENKIDFYETYRLKENKLECIVESKNVGNHDWESTVTLAYDIEKIEFDCIVYSEDKERVFRPNNSSPSGNLKACHALDSSSIENVIAVKTTITLAKSGFNRLDDDYEHSFVTTLRTNLTRLAE